MSKNLHDELSARTPVWTDAAAIEREARAYRNAYIAAATQRGWQKLSGAVRNALRTTSAPRHAA